MTTFDPFTAATDRLLGERMNDAKIAIEQVSDDYNIMCATCKYYTQNTPIKDIDRNVCGNEANAQTGYYGKQYLVFGRTGYCHNWEEFLGESV